MFTHEPKGYKCQFCLVVSGIENEHVLTRQEDIIFKDEHITALIASHWWPNNKGHVLIIPNTHIENIYTLSVDLSNRIHALEIEVAKALKAQYKCDGVSTRQHNEPHGNQDVWHYHLHIFPRYEGDNLYRTSASFSAPEDRIAYAQSLRDYFHR